MYNASSIKTGLLGSTPLISWRQNPDAGGIQLTAMTGTPTSGLYFNDFHPLLTHDNLFSLLPDYIFTQAAGSTKNTAVTNWLKNQTEAWLIMAVEDWLNEKFKNRSANNLLDRDTLFTNAPGWELDTNESKLAMFEFVPVRSKGVKMTIEQIGVQFAEDCAFTLHLFKSNESAAVATEGVDYTSAGGIQWVTVNWELDGEGSYLVVYDQTETGEQSINTIFDHTHLAGGIPTYPKGFACGSFYSAMAAKVTPSVLGGGIGSMELENDFVIGGDTDKRFNIADLEYTSDTNFGLNFKLNVQCDYTNFILEQKNLFKSAFGYMVAKEALRALAHNANVRVNRNLAHLDTQAIMYEIDGNPQGISGSFKTSLGYKYDRALQSIQLNTTGIDKVCLPCARKGVKFTSV